MPIRPESTFRAWLSSMSDQIKQPTRTSLSTLRKWLKLTIFALFPAVALIASLEVILRITEASRPTKSSIPLPEELFGMLRPDATLMWSLVPSQEFRYANQSSGYRTNSLGLRSREISPEKQGNEYRILSLGESTTYGYGVANDETYSAQLETLLNAGDGEKEFQVINAGVPAWSSFQSLLFLKERGIKLEPDMVLLYNEFNDYLPTSYRSSSSTQKQGLSKTDREIYESILGKLSRSLLAHSAIFRFIQYRVETHRMNSATALQTQGDWPLDQTLGSQLGQIGMASNTEISPRLAQAGEIDETQLPRRVSPAERTQILLEIADFCDEHGIELVIIHPSYRFTQPHECLLTEFCSSQDVPMFDAHTSLHQPSLSPEEQFLDSLHPTPSAHAQVAADLFTFLQRSDSFPEVSEPQETVPKPQ